MDEAHRRELYRQVAATYQVPERLLSGGAGGSAADVEVYCDERERYLGQWSRRADRQITQPLLRRLRRKLYPCASRGWRRHVRRAKAAARRNVQ